MSISRLPAWACAAIAAIPIAILALFYARLDTVSRIELTIPAVFWALAFVAVACRRSHRRG